MSFSVSLIDRSEIVQKMLSHCLYYFSAEVFRFENWKDSQSHFSEKKPDIVFVDWEIEQENNPVIYNIIEEIKPAPVVLLYRPNHQIEALSLKSIPHRLKKPLDPKTARDLFSELIPRVKESKIHPFLKFPTGSDKKAPVQEKQSFTKFEPAVQEITSPEAFSQFNKPKKEEAESSRQTVSPVAPKQNFSEERPLKESGLGQKISTAKKTISFSLKKEKINSSPSDENSLSPTREKDQDGSGTKAKKSLTPAAKIKPLSAPPSVLNKINKLNWQDKKEREETLEKKMNKERLNIDEDTKNDLAPMAIKSPASEQADSHFDKKIELSEKDIIRVLNKYKDSLEFQELMENVLSEYAEQAVKHILQEDKTANILPPILKEFKESQQFKKLVERQIIGYVKQELPSLIKEIVEKEIKKIIGS